MSKRVLITTPYPHAPYWFNYCIGESFPYIETVEWVNGGDAYRVDLTGSIDGKSGLVIGSGDGVVPIEYAELIED